MFLLTGWPLTIVPATTGPGTVVESQDLHSTFHCFSNSTGDSGTDIVTDAGIDLTDAGTDIVAETTTLSSTVSILTTPSAVSCPSYDYSPCQCLLQDSTRSINCLKVFVQDVKRLFSDAPPDDGWNEFFTGHRLESTSPSRPIC